MALSVAVIAGFVLTLASISGYSALRDHEQAQSDASASDELSVLSDEIRAGVLPEVVEASMPFEISTATHTLVASPLVGAYDQDAPLFPAGATPPVFGSGPGRLVSDTDSVDIGTSTANNYLAGQRLDVVYSDVEADKVPASIGAHGRAVRITVFVTSLPSQEVLKTVRSSLSRVVPALVLVIVLFVWFTVGRALAPIEAIRRRMVDVSSSNIAARVPQPITGDEVEKLAIEVNRALARLDTADQRQREFIADAAHELRSPIAAMQTSLEVAQRYPEHLPPADALEAVARQVRRLARLSDDLLLLGSLDGPAPQPDVGGQQLENREAAAPSTVDLVAIVREEAAATARVTPTLSLPDTRIQIEAPAGELSRAVANLLSNAARHADSSLEVSVRLLPHRPLPVELAVTNDGPLIPIEDRERIFDRLVRLDDARDLDSGGSGLGLAITRRIAERAGGTVEATERHGLTTFILRLPLDPKPPTS